MLYFSRMSRSAFITLLILATVATSAHAQVFKKIDPSKVSDFSGKQFESKSWGTKGYGTKEYKTKGKYGTKTYETQSYFYSSKNFETKTSPYSSKQNYIAKEVPAKRSVSEGKEYVAKGYETKNVDIPPLTYKIADKPVTDWHTLIRNEKPKGMPGRHQEIPFSEWKASSEAK